MKRYFQISVHALILTAFLALALTGRLDAPSIILFAVGAGWSFHRTIKDLPPPLSPKGAFVLSLVYIFVFLIDTGIVSRSFIPATIHLVLFLELVKLCQEKTDRDYFYLIVLAFLKILAASSLTINMSFAVTLVFFLIALVSTLMSFDMYRSERKVSSRTAGVAVPLGSMSVWATGWILLIGVALFFLIPRVGTGYFSRASTPSLLLSGFTENVQLGQIGQVKLSSAVVMHAKRIGGSSSALVRWRGIALDRFNGKGWFRTNRAHAAIAAAQNQTYTLRPMDNSGERTHYRVLLEPLATNALFGPHRVRSIRGTFQGLEVDGDDGIFNRAPALRRIQYEVISEIPIRRMPNTAAAEPEQIPADIGRQYLRLPPATDPAIRALAEQITGQARTISEKAAAVETYLKANYKYTLELDWTPGDQPVSTFLLSAKAGHCEYFASSMAILLRAVGVPTRIVNGFLMGEYNPIGGDYIIRQSDAHSWVEVYVPDQGWLEFDPTPPDPRERPTGWMAQLAHYVDAAELYWNSYILVYDSGLQFQLFRSAQDTAQSFQTNIRNRSDQWIIRSQVLSDRVAGQMQRMFDNIAFWTFVTLLALGIAGLRYRTAIRTQLVIWRLRNGAGTVNDDVIAEMFYRAARLAEREGHRRAPAQTWREWILALPDAGGRGRLAKALEIFEKSKYGRLPVSAAEFTVLEQAIRELKA